MCADVGAARAGACLVRKSQDGQIDGPNDARTRLRGRPGASAHHERGAFAAQLLARSGAQRGGLDRELGEAGRAATARARTCSSNHPGRGSANVMTVRAGAEAIVGTTADAFDPQDNILLTGGFYGSIEIAGKDLLSNEGGSTSDVFVAKLKP
jgi:hypothetical protein